MAVIPGLDRRSIVRGAAVGVAVILPVLVAFQLLEPGEDSNLTFVFFGLMFAGWTAAGAVAAREQPGTPFSHGVLAALAAFAVFAAVRLAVLAVRGPTETDTATAVVYVAFNGLVAATAGILGAALALRFR